MDRLPLFAGANAAARVAGAARAVTVKLRKLTWTGGLLLSDAE